MWFAFLMACGDKFENPQSYEGDEAGECTDGADNDLDGLFDCNDEGCAGSPDCENVGEPSGEPSSEPSGEPSGEPSAEPSNEPSTEDTGDTGEEPPPPACDPDPTSGESVQAGNLPVQIIGSTLDPTPRSDFAGWDVVICDLDADGYDDLAVGVPNAGGGLGRVSIYYGPGDDWSQFMNTTGNFADAYVYSAGGYGFLGQRVECGDINADGDDDLVIGSGQGTVISTEVPLGVHAFYNTGSKMEGQVDVATADVRMSYNAASSNHWPSFWLADVDNDFSKEILYFVNQNSFFGSPAANADNKIWVLDADNGQIGSMEDHTIFKITPPEVDGVADIQHVDGDLLIGQGVHYGSSIQDGAVSMLPTPLGANVNLETQATATWTGASNGAMGSSLAFDDFNLDGNIDMVIGAKGNGGALYVHYAGWETSTGNISGVNTADSSFTSSFNFAGLGQQMSTVGDINEDGYPDLLATALGDYGSGDYGKAYVVDGLCLDGQMTNNIDGAALYRITGEAINDGFGWAAAVGDINGDGVDDFAVSAPYHMPDPNTGIWEGKVYLWMSGE